MHPRLEGVAVDGPDHIDGMTHIGISGPLPDHLGVRAAWLSVREPGKSRCTQCRTGSIVTAATPSTNTQGNAAENQRRLARRPDMYLFFRMGTYSRNKG